MPCYTQWDAYLDKDSNEYRAAKAKLRAKLKAVQHVIDYYYRVSGLTVPRAKHSQQQTWMEMAHHGFECDEVGDLKRKEEQIIKSVAHHCSCDGIHFTLLYNLVTLLDIQDGQQGGYARAILAVANEIRSNKAMYDFRS